MHPTSPKSASALSASSPQWHTPTASDSAASSSSGLRARTRAASKAEAGAGEWNDALNALAQTGWKATKAVSQLGQQCAKFGYKHAQEVPTHIWVKVGGAVVLFTAVVRIANQFSGSSSDASAPAVSAPSATLTGERSDDAVATIASIAKPAAQWGYELAKNLVNRGIVNATERLQVEDALNFGIANALAPFVQKAAEKAQNVFHAMSQSDIEHCASYRNRHTISWSPDGGAPIPVFSGDCIARLQELNGEKKV